MCYLCDFVQTLPEPPFALLVTKEDKREELYPLYEGANTVAFKHVPGTLHITLMPDGEYRNLSIEPTQRAEGDDGQHELSATILINASKLVDVPHKGAFDEPH